jgi:hypothetical protein
MTLIIFSNNQLQLFKSNSHYLYSQSIILHPSFTLRHIYTISVSAPNFEEKQNCFSEHKFLIFLWVQKRQN